MLARVLGKESEIGVGVDDVIESIERGIVESIAYNGRALRDWRRTI